MSLVLARCLLACWTVEDFQCNSRVAVSDRECESFAVTVWACLLLAGVGEMEDVAAERGEKFYLNKMIRRIKKLTLLGK